MNVDSFPRSWLRCVNLKVFAINSRQHLLPNLWCLCSTNLFPKVVDIDDQQISFSIDEDGKTFGLSAVYASTNHIKRRELWQKLSWVQNNALMPWCFIGDFNTILGAHEHSGRHVPAHSPMDDFFQWSDSNNYVHLPTRGMSYTWSNGRRGSNHTEKRLDRSICSLDFIDTCSSISCSTLTKTRSDHFPLLLDFQSSNARHASSFRFMSMWLLHPTCKDEIINIWNTSIAGCPMFVLCKKLKLLKDRLKVWNKETFGNVHDQLKKAEDKVNIIQETINACGHNDDLMDQEKQAQIELDIALQMENAFWQEKAKVNWSLEGDRNTSYFHRIAKIKSTTKRISALKNGDTLLSDKDDISEHIVQHFTSIFNTSSSMQDNGLIAECIPKLINEDINNLLTLLPSHAEINHAVFALNSNGAPGPDGFGAIFFQTFWEIVQTDVVNAVTQFFQTGWILPNFNVNTMVLIPKIPNADVVEQFRPIAMANFKFKIISKILADRLAPIMPSIISPEQRGFIHGRLIRDCICLTSEAINLLHNKSYGGNLALKIDISKAFDTINWDFLLKVLNSFGFSSKFCDWISAILKSAKLSISINGQLHGFFSCSRGVRQADPLSPLLFCIAEDVLSRGISKLVESGNLELIKGTRHLNVPSHTLYADDIMIFCKGKLSNIDALMNLFDRYAASSGQNINPAKSTIFAGSINQARLHNIADKLGFSIGSTPFVYLGVPIFKGKPKARFLKPFVDKVKSKLAAWKASLLSIAGRVQLIKSVVHGMLLHSFLIYS
jgi:hypothetical protein